MIAVIGGIVLFFAAFVLLARWVFRVDDIVFYLEKINEKLAQQQNIDTKADS
jgi:hypothetical protein